MGCNLAAITCGGAKVSAMKCAQPVGKFPVANMDEICHRGAHAGEKYEGDDFI
jgi:hypothetical protein